MLCVGDFHRIASLPTTFSSSRTNSLCLTLFLRSLRLQAWHRISQQQSCPCRLQSHLDCSPQIYRPAQCPTSDCCVVCRRSSGQCLQRLPSSGEAGPSLSSEPQRLIVFKRTAVTPFCPGAGWKFTPRGLDSTWFRL